MPKFTLHLLASAGALQYAEHEIEADSPAEAKEKVVAGLEDGSIKPDWFTAHSGVPLKDQSEKVFLHGIEDDEDNLDPGPQLSKDHLDATKTTAGPATDLDQRGNLAAIPTNSPAVGRFSRPEPETMAVAEPIAAGAMPPPKTRPGAFAIPKAEAAGDPTKSPTPGADGVTHVPLSQRSQAIPTSRTLGQRDASTMSAPQETAREREDAALKARMARDEADEAEAKKRMAAESGEQDPATKTTGGAATDTAGHQAAAAGTQQAGAGAAA